MRTLAVFLFLLLSPLALAGEDKAGAYRRARLAPSLGSGLAFRQPQHRSGRPPRF